MQAEAGFKILKPVQWNATLWPSDYSEDSTEELDFLVPFYQEKRDTINLLVRFFLIEKMNIPLFLQNKNLDESSPLPPSISSTTFQSDIATRGTILGNFTVLNHPALGL